MEKSPEEIAELIRYTRWYGGIASDQATIQWLDEHCGEWRLADRHQVVYSFGDA